MILTIVKRAVRSFTRKSDWRDIQRVRSGFEMIGRKYQKTNKACRYESFQIERMKAEWIIPIGQPDTHRALLYFHGGGYATGSINTHRAHVAQLVMYSGIRALVIEYRLAPEHQYPAAVEDAVMAYQWLLHSGYLAERIALGGDSAGGGLTVAALLYIRDRGIAMPRCAVCMSPFLDLTLSGASMATQERADPMLVRKAFPLWVANYLGSADPRSPYASPVFADLHGLPPVYVQVGSEEMLLDDSTRFAERAQAAGSPVTLDIYPGYFHVFQAFFRVLKTARDANKKLAAFIVQQIGA